MQIFSKLEEAKTAGVYLGRYGQYPTIYKRDIRDYIIVEKNEWPPSSSWPFLKWGGTGWIPVLTRLDTIEQAQEASGLFSLLGYDPILVEFPGITFDIFLKETHIPTGAWIISELDSNYSVKYMKQSQSYEDTEDIESESVDIEIYPM